MTSECGETRADEVDEDEGAARERLRAVRSAGVRCMVCRTALVLASVQLVATGERDGPHLVRRLGNPGSRRPRQPGDSLECSQ